MVDTRFRVFHHGSKRRQFIQRLAGEESRSKLATIDRSAADYVFQLLHDAGLVLKFSLLT